MAHHRLHRLLLTFFLLSACEQTDGYGSYGDDDDAEQEEDDDNDPAANVKDAGGKDAGWKDAGVKDAGKWDAGSSTWSDAGSDDDDDDDDAQDEDEDQGSDEDEVADAGTGDAGRADAGANACATLTYETFGKQFLASYCTSCHGAAAPRANIRLDSLMAAASRKAGVKAQVLAGTMPQGNKKPTQDERTKLGQWIDCGAK